MNTYTYYCRLRPPAPGTQPKQGLIKAVDEKITHNSREYWGYVVYDRELTDKELYAYDLDR